MDCRLHRQEGAKVDHKPELGTLLLDGADPVDILSAAWQSTVQIAPVQPFALSCFASMLRSGRIVWARCDLKPGSSFGCCGTVVASINLGDDEHISAGS